MKYTRTLKILTRFLLIASVVALGILILRPDRKEHSYLGSGEPGPEKLVQSFVDSIRTQDYQQLRELLFFEHDRCLGFCTLSLNPRDRAMVDLFLSEHFGPGPNSIIDTSSPMYRNQSFYDHFPEMYEERVLGHRHALLDYLDAIANADIEVSGSFAEISFPRLNSNHDEGKTNLMELIEIEGRWFVANPSCHLYYAPLQVPLNLEATK